MGLMKNSRHVELPQVAEQALETLSALSWQGTSSRPFALLLLRCAVADGSAMSRPECDLFDLA